MNIKTFGFEKEFFFTGHGGIITHVPSELRHKADGCGYLLEARGKEMEDPHYAKALLDVEVARLSGLAYKHGLTLENVNTKEMPKEFLRICLRKFGKQAQHSYFMGGKVYKTSKPRAGLHIHFGNLRTIDGTSVAEQMNMPRIIALMDKEFMPDIKAAKRMPGEYELKAWGFEYRSLPATIDLNRVANVLQRIRNDD